MTIHLPDPGAPNPDFEQPADRARLERTAAALERRGFIAKIADSAEQARQLVLEAIPAGAEVHSALSETIRELGISAEIDDSGRYDSVRSRLRSLDRATQGREMRKLGAAPDYIVGSAHAITDDGEIVVASGSGSQLGAYAYAGGNVILVVGHQKLVRDVDEGLRRVREYSLPREFARMQGAGRPGTLLAKTLIIHQEPSGRVTVILVPRRSATDRGDAPGFLGLLSGAMRAAEAGMTHSDGRGGTTRVARRRRSQRGQPAPRRSRPGRQPCRRGR